MPHRNRTLVMVVSLIWVLAIVATLVNAAVRTGAGGDDEEDGAERSTAVLAEAPMPPAANLSPVADQSPPA